MTKSKRNLIIISCIVGSLILLAVLFGTLFSLRTIKVDFATSTIRVNEYVKEDIIKEAKLKKGKNIIFQNYANNEKNLEEKFPYAKFNIVRKFPNTAIIYVYERKPVIRIEQSGFWYIFDEDLKCLEVVLNSNLNLNNNDKVPVLDLKNFSLDVSTGEFLKNQNLKNSVTNIIDGVYGFEATPIDILSDIALSNNDILGIPQISLKIKDSGASIIIQGNNIIKEKIAYAMMVYASDVSQNVKYQGKLDRVTITVYQDFSLDNKRIVVSDGSEG